VEGEKLGHALITRRGESARLAAFALRPAYRGNGVSKRLAPLNCRLKAKGVRQMWLEVIADNQAGIGLYRSVGFEQQRDAGLSGQYVYRYPREPVGVQSP
jgi:ribosomal protein S18 acetylase RimI-like enzyme